MADLIERLRAAVDPPEVDDLEPFIHGLQRALLGVIARHEPGRDEGGDMVCPACFDAYEAGHAPALTPCAELYGLAQALGVEV